LEVRRVGWEDEQPVFRLIQHAWRVEVAHGRLGRSRRLAKSFENTTAFGDRLAPGGLHRDHPAPPVTGNCPPRRRVARSVTRPAGFSRGIRRLALLLAQSGRTTGRLQPREDMRTRAIAVKENAIEPLQAPSSTA
jgi:hypothetical protein